jgi:hypothetical protein
MDSFVSKYRQKDQYINTLFSKIADEVCIGDRRVRTFND